MAASPATRHTPTLEEFLRMPEIEEPPYLEFVEGRIEAKAMPTTKHGLIEAAFTNRLNAFALPSGLGLAVHELRHTFGGRSILPDISFQLAENLQLDAEGIPSNFVDVAPDIHIEILSPDQSLPKTHAKLLFSLAHGCAIGILINPEARVIDLYRPNRLPERLDDKASIDLAPVLPGLQIPVSEVFGWMVIRLKKPGAGPV